MSRQIPLFPLSTVLYPGLILPLHVFERRYTKLVEHLLAQPDGTPREFGVVAIREGREVGTDGIRSVHEVGCTALLRDVDELGEGRYDITTVGDERFRVLDVDWSGDFPIAEVEDLGEPEGAADVELDLLAAAVTRGFARYRAALQGTPPEDDDLATSGLEAQTSDGEPAGPPDPSVLSYAVAAAMILDVRDKQALLGASDTADRLRRERVLLRREQQVIRALPSLPAVEMAYLPVAHN